MITKEVRFMDWTEHIRALETLRLHVSRIEQIRALERWCLYVSKEALEGERLER